MNKKWTALNNCYDVREMGLADFASSPDNLYGPAPYGLNDAARRACQEQCWCWCLFA